MPKVAASDSPTVKFSDPVHYYLSRLVRLDLDLDLRSHLLLASLPFKRRTQPPPTFESRVLIAIALQCYTQAQRVGNLMEVTKPTDDNYEKLARIYRGQVECLAKVLRIKGMRTPGPRARPKKELMPLGDSAADRGPEAREEEAQVIGAEA